MQKLNLYCPKYTLLNVMEEAGLPLEWAVIGGEIYYKGDDFDDYLDLIDYSYKSVEPVCFGTAVFSDLSIHKVQWCKIDSVNVTKYYDGYYTNLDPGADWEYFSEDQLYSTYELAQASALKPWLRPQ